MSIDRSKQRELDPEIEHAREALRVALRHFGQATLAVEVGVNGQTLADFVNGDVDRPRAQNLNRILSWTLTHAAPRTEVGDLGRAFTSDEAATLRATAADIQALLTETQHKLRFLVSMLASGGRTGVFLEPMETEDGDVSQSPSTEAIEQAIAAQNELGDPKRAVQGRGRT